MTSPDLVSLVFTLKPLASPSAQETPSWWGRAAHALLLNVVRQYDPALAASLHEDPVAIPEAAASTETASGSAANSDLRNPQAYRPFTASSLMGRFPGKRLDAQATYALRLAGLHSAISGILLQAAESGPLQPGQKVELDYIPFGIVGMPESPWAKRANYSDLGAPLLLGKEPAPRRVSLLFTSPTCFRSGGKQVPVPLPELVFGSLLERWNAFAPIVFPPETRRYASECLALSKYDLATRPAPSKGGGMRVGAIGQATYTCINFDRYWMSVIGTLAAFALFSGVGAATTNGMGQCRSLGPEEIGSARDRASHPDQ